MVRRQIISKRPSFVGWSTQAWNASIPAFKVAAVNVIIKNINGSAIPPTAAVTLGNIVVAGAQQVGNVCD